MANRHRESARLASEQITLFDSAADPTAIFGVMSAGMFAKLHAGEVNEALRVAQAVIDLIGDDESKGAITGWGLGSPLTVALRYRANCRAALGDSSWRADLQRAVALQRQLGEPAVVVVIRYGYSVAATNRMLMPDAADSGEMLIRGAAYGAL